MSQFPTDGQTDAQRQAEAEAKRNQTVPANETAEQKAAREVAEKAGGQRNYPDGQVNPNRQ